MSVRRPSLPMRMRRALPLLLILILAVALRLPGLGRDSFWYDEMLSVTLARMPLAEMFRQLIIWEQIPPLHHLILFVWIRVFGDSEASARLPSLIASVASVWMAYILVANLLGRRIALGTALLLATASFHIEYARECRAYALAVLLSLWSCERFVTLLRQPTQRNQLLYIAATILLLYTHVYGVFIIAAQNLYYLFRLASTRGALPLPLKPWIFVQLAIAALYSPWVPIIIRWTRDIHINFWVKQASLDDIPVAYWTFSGQTPVFLIMIALTVLGIARFRRRASSWLLVLLMLTPVLIPVTISILTRPSFAPRYALPASVAIYALAAAGAMALRPRWLGLAALAIVATLSPFGEVGQIVRPHWREVGQYLNENMHSGDLAVLNLRAATRFYDYYVHRPDVRRVGVDTLSLPATPPLDGRRIWLIAQDPRHPVTAILRRGPWRIERRFYTPHVLVLEVTDEPLEENVDGG